MKQTTTTNDQFPEINGLSLSAARAAIALGEANRGALKPAAQTELDARLSALRERVRRLTATETRIRATQAAR